MLLWHQNTPESRPHAANRSAQKITSLAFCSISKASFAFLISSDSFFYYCLAAELPWRIPLTWDGSSSI